MYIEHDVDDDLISIFNDGSVFPCLIMDRADAAELYANLRAYLFRPEGGDQTIEVSPQA